MVPSTQQIRKLRLRGVEWLFVLMYLISGKATRNHIPTRKREREISEANDKTGIKGSKSLSHRHLRAVQGRAIGRATEAWTASISVF